MTDPSWEAQGWRKSRGVWREITLSWSPGKGSPHHRVTPQTFSSSLSLGTRAWASAPCRAQDTREQWACSKMLQEFECPTCFLRGSPQEGCSQSNWLPSHKSLPGQGRFLSSTQSRELIDQKSGEGGRTERRGFFSDALPLVWNGGESQILVGVRRSRGVGHCSPDSPNLG